MLIAPAVIILISKLFIMKSIEFSDAYITIAPLISVKDNEYLASDLIYHYSCFLGIEMSFVISWLLYQLTRKDFSSKVIVESDMNKNNINLLIRDMEKILKQLGEKSGGSNQSLLDLIKDGKFKKNISSRTNKISLEFWNNYNVEIFKSIEKLGSSDLKNLVSEFYTLVESLLNYKYLSQIKDKNEFDKLFVADSIVDKLEKL